MRYYDEYMNLYNMEDDKYYEYVCRELDKIKRRYNNERKRNISKNR